MRVWHAAFKGQVECTVGFSARRGSRSGWVTCANNDSNKCFAHVLCTDNGFAAITSSLRSKVRRTPNCFTAHILKLGKRIQCVLYAISFSAVSIATSVFELSQADIFCTITSSHKYRRDCDCGTWVATMQHSRLLQLTARRVADCVRDAKATITTRHDCANRNRN